MSSDSCNFLKAALVFMCGKQTGDGHGAGREGSLEDEVARSADRPPVRQGKEGSTWLGWTLG